MDKPPNKKQVIVDYLKQHKGQSMRPTDIAAALGFTTHEAAVKCRQLSQQGRILRTHNAKTRKSTYAYPA